MNGTLSPLPIPREYESVSGVSRRRLLQIGSVSLVGLSLPEFLWARDPYGAGSGLVGPEKSCIFVFLQGGPPHLDTFDPKPGQAETSKYKPIATTVPGLRISEMLPELAKRADRYCLIRSMSHADSIHETAINGCLTGQFKPSAEVPMIGSVLAKLRPTANAVPPYVWLMSMDGNQNGDRYRRGGGFLGPVYNHVEVGTGQDHPGLPNFRVKGLDPPPDLPPERTVARFGLLSALEHSGSRWVQTGSPGEKLRRFQERAIDLVTGPEAQRAFNLDQEPGTVRDRYGRHVLGQNLLFARRLIEGGVRLVSVVGWTGTPDGDRKGGNLQTWDMHSSFYKGNDNMYGSGEFGLGFALPRLDQAVSALLDDLGQRGLLQSTRVVVVGEFGRAPRIDQEGRGRDHWPYCYSALLAGAGIRGGAIYGDSDKTGAYVRNDPVSLEDFGATVFHALGVPPETRLGADGFTNPVSPGQPIRKLFE
jgi:hypothetical protein